MHVFDKLKTAPKGGYDGEIMPMVSKLTQAEMIRHMGELTAFIQKGDNNE